MEKEAITKETIETIIENLLEQGQEHKGLTRTFHRLYGRPYFDRSPAPGKPGEAPKGDIIDGTR